MSYSFSVVGSSKADVKQKIADSFANVVTNQPSHAADRDAAIAGAGGMVDVLKDPADGEEIHVSIHGSLSWQHEAADAFTGASVGVSATVRAKATA
ncbi:hypothetical protein [Bradyrhizobium sp. SEMIA]|uniref:hypothetical protein n=1 Tax=Bradyrhizobium sp. SEMIA TaxID=2597515 RepID=UPI0018A5140D|nr:hypothetical protein [Bradyrhizobium sp. SEMIA]QOG20481.1 hypothetical protein FOM02_27125 [Bradyrhizobium sp. SEMIA]